MDYPSNDSDKDIMKYASFKVISDKHNEEVLLFLIDETFFKCKFIGRESIQIFEKSRGNKEYKEASLLKLHYLEAGIEIMAIDAYNIIQDLIVKRKFWLKLYGNDRD